MFQCTSDLYLLRCMLQEQELFLLSDPSPCIFEKPASLQLVFPSQHVLKLPFPAPHVLELHFPAHTYKNFSSLDHMLKNCHSLHPYVLKLSFLAPQVIKFLFPTPNVLKFPFPALHVLNAIPCPAEGRRVRRHPVLVVVPADGRAADCGRREGTQPSVARREGSSRPICQGSYIL